MSNFLGYVVCDNVGCPDPLWPIVDVLYGNGCRTRVDLCARCYEVAVCCLTCWAIHQRSAGCPKAKKEV